MKLSIAYLILAAASLVSAADFGFTVPEANATYRTGDTVTIQWHDYDGTRPNASLWLGVGQKALHWHPYKIITNLTEPFPTSYTWSIPKNFKKQRYYLVITNETPYQPKSDYFFVA
ncbi:hypothetical protein BGW37DRAFT_76023 [Umbelopsis sp. PMI_123]|nr:hypothetical protein BGW37DRAFT_76023 [Umbelopsis sp. PMI_123]